MTAVEHRDPDVVEHGRDLVGPTAVVVVVSEHCEHRLADLPAGVGERRRLLHEPVCRQISCEQHHIRVVAESAEHTREVVRRSPEA